MTLDELKVGDLVIIKDLSDGQERVAVIFEVTEYVARFRFVNDTSGSDLLKRVQPTWPWRFVTPEEAAKILFSV